MRRVLACLVIAFLVGPAAAFAQPVAGPAKAKAATPEMPFESVANFFKLPPGIYMGEGVGVATNSKGHVFVYTRSGETRLFEFDQNGAFVKEFGVGSYGFSFAHAVRVDKDDNVWAVDAKGNVYVADRGNNRIVVLDNDLNQKAVYDTVGAPWAVCITNTPHQYLFSSNSFPTGNNFDQAPITGEVYKMELDGTVLGRFGKAGHGFKEFSSIHQMDCRTPDELYVAEITAWRVQKIRLRPTTSTAASGR